MHKVKRSSQLDVEAWFRFCGINARRHREFVRARLAPPPEHLKKSLKRWPRSLIDFTRHLRRRYGMTPAQVTSVLPVEVPYSTVANWMSKKQ